MTLRTRLRRRLDGKRDRGVVAVEAAIITPIFILILIGVLEFGLVFKDQLAVTSAVRAGARIASAEPRLATFASDAADAVAHEGSALDMTQVQSLWVYKADTSGHPIGAGGTFSSCATSCVQFTWSAAQSKFVQSSGSWPATSQDACYGEQDSIGVYLSFKHDAVTNLIFNTMNLTSHTTMRLEPYATVSGSGCKP
jgi:hypothetical protein